MLKKEVAVVELPKAGLSLQFVGEQPRDDLGKGGSVAMWDTLRLRED